VLSADEARELLNGMDVSTVVSQRDRALITVMTYTFAGVSGIMGSKVDDYYLQKKLGAGGLRASSVSDFHSAILDAIGGLRRPRPDAEQ
jgi:hypothetical protein